MFKALYGKSLDEETIESWFEKGRNSKMGYHFLLVIWNPVNRDYQPAFVETRQELTKYQRHISNQEILVATYDLYSESRITSD